MQRVGGVRWCGAPFNVVNGTPLVGDDQGAFKLPHVLGVDAEVGLHRHFHMNAFRDVDERTTGPHRRVESGELVVAVGDDGAEMLLDDLRVFTKAAVHVKEKDPLSFEVFADGVVNRLGLVLGRNATEVLLFSLRNAETVEGSLDVFGDVVPIPLGGVGGTKEIRHVVKIDVVQFTAIAPVGHFALHEMVVGLDPNLRHPLGLVFELRDVSNNLLTQPFVEADGGVFRVVESKTVVANRLTGFVTHTSTSVASSQS